MSNIEERVVKMQFDNSQFERRVKTTINSLNDLKKASNLKGAAAGMEELQRVANAFSLAKISTGVESLQKRFSTFGIVGMRVIQNVTDSLMNLTKKAAGFVTGGILTGGKNRAFNLENAHFQLLGLLKDEQAVADVMKNVSDSVDGTAYSLDAAATVASQLAASGMRAGDQMFSSLRAVAGVAAMTNSEYSDIGRIFTQVAGQGKLMGDQLLQLSGRGMNAAATLADYLTRVGNGAQVTEAEVREMVSDGQIDFATFAAAMDDAFGEHAKKANETFSGALSNIRAALGRIGAMFYSPLIVQNGALVQMFNAIRVKINDVKKALEPFAAFVTNNIIKMAERAAKAITAFDVQKPIAAFKKLNDGIGSVGDKFKIIFSKSNAWNVFNKFLEKAGVSADSFKNKLLEVAKAEGTVRFTQIQNLLKMLGGVENLFNSGRLRKSEIIEVFKRLADDADKAGRAVEITTESLEHFQAMTIDVIRGNWGNGEERIRRLTEAGEDQVAIQKLVNKVWERNGQTWDDCTISIDDLTEVIGNLSDSELESAGYTEDQVKILRELADQAKKTGTPLSDLLEQMKKPTTTELIFDSARRAVQSLMTIFDSAKTAFFDVFGSFKITPKQIYSFAEAVNDFSKRLVITENAADKITRAFKGVFTIVKMLATFIGGVGKVAFALITDAIELAVKILLIFTSGAGDAIVAVDKFGEKNKWFKNIVNKLVSAIHSVTETVSEYIDKFDEWATKNEVIQKSIQFIKDAIDKGKESIKDWYNTLSENAKFKSFMDTLPKIIEYLPGAIKAMAAIIVEASSGIFDAVSKWFDKFMDIPKIQQTLEVFKKYFGPFADFFKERFDTLKDNGGKFLDLLKEVGSWSFDEAREHVKKFASIIYDNLDGIKSKLSDFAGFIKNNVSIPKLLALFLGVGIYKDIKQITRIPKGIGGTIGALTGVFKSISGLFNEVSETLKYKKKVNMFKEIAGSVALLAGSIALLASYPVEKIKTAATILGIVSGAMFGFGMLLSVLEKTKGFKISDMTNLNSMMKPLITLAASIWIFGQAMEKLTEIDWTNINSILAVGVIAVLEGFTTLFSYLSKLGGGASGISALTMVSLAASVIILAKAVDEISKLHINKNTVAKTGFILAVVEILALISKTQTKMGSFGLGMISMAGSVIILAKAVDEISKLHINKNTVAKTGFILAVVEILALISKTQTKMGSFGLGMISMAGSIYVLVKVMNEISKMDVKSLRANAEVIGYIVGLMVSMALDARLAGPNAAKAGTGILLMSASVVVITEALKMISKLDAGSIENGLEVIVTTFGMFAIIIGTSKLAGDKISKVGTMALKMSTAIAIISASVIALSSVDQNDIRKAEGVITHIGILMATMVGVSKLGGNKNSLQILALAAAISALGGIVIALSLINRDKLRQAEESIIVIAAVIAALVTIPVNASPSKIVKTIAVLGLMIVAMGSISLLLWGLSKLDVKANLANATALSELLLAITAAMGVLQFVSIESAGKAIADIAVFLGGSVSILTIAGCLAKIAGFKSTINDGIGVLQDIGRGIGNFIGGLVGGTAEGLTASLPGIASNLTAFMDNIQGFLNGAKQIDESVVNGVANLSEAILSLTKATFMDALTSFFTGSWITGNDALGRFGNSLATFGKSLKKYSDSVEGVNVSAIDNSAEASNSLIEVLQTIPKVGGLAQAIFGEKSWDTLSTGLATFGRVLKGYSIIVADIDADAVIRSVPAGKALSDLLSGLSPAGGLVQSVFGSKSWPTLTTGLVPFGRVLKAYASIVEDMNIEAVQNSVRAGQALSDLLGTLQNAGGLVQSVFGSKSWSTLTTGLGTLGDALVSYSGKVANINLEAITNSVSAANTIKMVLDTLNVMKDKTVEDICYNIGLMGGYLNTYGQNISMIDTDQMHNVSEKLRELGQVVNYINSVNYDNLEGFGSAIKNFAKSGITKFVDFTSTDQATITEYGKKIVKAMISGVTSMKTGSDKSARDIITSFMNTMSNTINATRGRVTSALTQALSSICTQGANKVRSFNGIYYQAGRNLGLQLANGIRTTIGISSSAVAAACSSAAITARGYYGSFYSAGVYVASGFAAGITANTYAAQARAAAMASAAASAARRALQIASPSKVFYSIGNFAGMGLVNALIAWSSEAFSAGEQMAKSAMEGVQGLGDLLASIIAEDVDVAPTITPVIDLTNVTSGLATMDSMFGARQISLNSDTSNRLGSGIQTLNQNGITIGKVGDNSDVVSSIRNLTDRVDKLGASMTRMQVVLDTGATVGAIAPSMDRQLGRMEAYKERGI